MLRNITKNEDNSCDGFAPTTSDYSCNETSETSEATNKETEIASRSSVWLSFTKLNKTSAQCNICSKIMKTANSTTTLWRHFRSHKMTTDGMCLSTYINWIYHSSPNPEGTFVNFFCFFTEEASFS